jgi:hypothetical protein
MKVTLGPENPEAEKQLSIRKHDGSGVGINYVDAYMKGVKLTTEDGRKITFKRRGLKLTFAIGDRVGDGLLRRLQNGPDEKNIVHKAIEEAAGNAGARFAVEDGVMTLEFE